jgi:hypothetical protein
MFMELIPALSSRAIVSFTRSKYSIHRDDPPSTADTMSALSMRGLALFGF